MSDDNPHGRDVTRRSALRKGAIASGVLVTGGTALTGSAAAEQPTRFDLSGAELYNPCTDEDMEITRGQLQVLARAHPDNGGGFHVNVHANTQGVQAVGDESDLNYQLNATVSVNANVRPPYPVVITAVANATVPSQGSEENLILRIRFHFTVNADGEVTAVRLEATDDCV